MDFYEIWNQLTTGILENDFFKATAVTGMLMSAITAAFLWLRRIPGVIGSLFYRYSTVHISLEHKQGLFAPMMRYLGDTFKDTSFGSFINIDFQGDNKFPSGTRWHRKGLCWIQSSLSRRELDNADASDAVTYTVHLSFYGFRKKKVMDDLLKHVETAYSSGESMHIYTYSMNHWCHVGELSKRPWESIVHPHSTELLADLKKFRQSEDWYVDRSIPWRRGYFFYGPPGTGKSSAVKALAWELGMDLRIINLNSATSNSLTEAFAYDNCLFLIEDIDATGKAAKRGVTDADLFENEFGIRTKESGKTHQLGVTLSDLLNAIDGVASGDGNILIMTSNHPESLDPALLRPGRVDVKYEFGYLTQACFEDLTFRYYGKKPDCRVPENMTAAQLQDIFIRNRDNFNHFLQSVKEAHNVSRQ